MKKNQRIITYVVLIIILTTLGSLGLTESLSRNDKAPIRKEENPNEIIITDNKTKDSNYELIVNLYNDITCDEQACEKIIKIKTETPDAKELVVKHYANYILIYDGVLKLINVNTKEIEELSLNYNIEDIYSINLKEESENAKENAGLVVESIIGINENSIKYLDYSTLEVTESEQYQKLTKIDEYYLGQTSDNILHLLDKKGSKIIELNKEISIDNLNKIRVNNEHISVEYNNTRNITFIIYDLTGKEIIKKSGNYTNIELGENEAYVYENGKIVVYNWNGKISKIIDLATYEVKYTYNNYMFGVKDNNLISYNINDNQARIITNIENKEIMSITYKNNNKPGIYITLKENEDETGIYYNLETNAIENFNLN